MYTLPDISNYYNLYDNVLILFGALLMDLVIIYLARYFPSLFGDSLNEWYTKFQFSAVLSDILIVLIGFMIARYIYTTWIKSVYGWNPLIFLALLVGIQVIRDILFYLAVVLPIPIGHNQVIDLFKKYSLSSGSKIIGSDAILMIMTALTAMYYKAEPAHVLVLGGVFAVYNLTYVLYTKPARS